MSQISVFISYSRKDIEFAEKLYHDLLEQGFDVWWDKRRLDNRGTSFLQEIRDAISTIDRFVLVVSPDSVASEWVGYEWEHALKLCKAINPVLVRGTYDIIPEELALLDAPNFIEGNYDDTLAYLMRQMREPVPLGALRGDMPQLPMYYLPRDEAFQRVRDYVLRDVKTTTAITGKARATGIQGMGGIGKSVLATAIAHDCEIRRSFADGVYWLTLGQKPDLLSLHSALSVALGERASFQTVIEWKAHVQRLLEGKQCLLILDDVWEKAHADAFAVLSEQSRLLLTSRDVGLVQALEAENFALDVLEQEAALGLLAQVAATDKDSLPDTAYEVVRECGYLPLALTMVGAMVTQSKNIDWDDILEALQNADLEKIKADFDYPYPSVFAAIDISIKALGDDEARYLELAAFKEDARIPEATLLRYWQYTSEQDELDVKTMLNNLEKKALLRRDDEARLYLHDLQYDYIRRQAEKTVDAAYYHRLLLDAYNPNRDDKEWPEVEWDSYLHENIAYHLEVVGKLDILREFLLDFDFLQHKLDATDPNALIEDCNYLLNERPIQLLQSALSMSAHVLRKDKAQLAAQLIGRLGLHYDRQSAIDALLKQTQNYDEKPALILTTPTLQAAGGALIRTIEVGSGVNAITFSEDGKFAVSGSDDGKLRVWNWQSGQLLQTLLGHSECINSVVLQGDIAFSGSQDGTLRIWNWQTGNNIHTLKIDLGWVMNNGVQIEHSPIRAINSVALSEEIAISAYDDGTIKVWNWQSGKFIRILQAHSASVNRVVALIDKYVVSASSDQTVKVWNWQTGELLRTLEGHTDSVNSVVIQGEFALSVSGSQYGLRFYEDNTIKVWNWQTGELLRTLEGHTDSVNSVVIQGEFALSVSSDQTVKVWNWQSGELMWTLEGHSSPVMSVVVQGDVAVSASKDMTLKVWNWRTGELLHTLEGHSSPVMSVVVQGNVAVSASKDMTLKVWNWRTGELLHTLEGHSGTVNSVVIQGEVALSASGDIFGKDNTIKVWNWRTGELLHTLEGHSSPVMSVVVQGNVAVSASKDMTLKVWNWRTGELLHTLEGHSSPVMSVVIQGEFALSASGDIFGKDNTIKVWNWRTGELLHTLEGHSSPVMSVVIQGEFALSVSSSQYGFRFYENNTIKAWNWQTGELLHTLEGHSSPVMSVVMQGNVAVSVSKDMTLKVWNWQTGLCLYTFYLDVPIRCVAIAEDRSTIVAGDEAGNVHFLRLNQGLRRLLGW